MFNILISFVCAFNLLSIFMITNKIKSLDLKLKDLSSEDEEKEIELL